MSMSFICSTFNSPPPSPVLKLLHLVFQLGMKRFNQPRCFQPTVFEIWNVATTTFASPKKNGKLMKVSWKLPWVGRKNLRIIRLPLSFGAASVDLSKDGLDLPFDEAGATAGCWWFFEDSTNPGVFCSTKKNKKHQPWKSIQNLVVFLILSWYLSLYQSATPPCPPPCWQLPKDPVWTWDIWFFGEPQHGVSLNGGFYPPFSYPKCWSFLVGKPHGFVGETHHFQETPTWLLDECRKTTLVDATRLLQMHSMLVP